MPLKTHVDEEPTMNLVSMIDVVLLLLIFFMVGTKFAEMERTVDLEVPEVADAGALTSAPAKRVVNVFRDGHVSLDGEDVADLGELTGRLAAARKQYADLGVVVRGDGSGPFQHVAEVLNACKQAGISELAIAVRLADAPR
jgi:biopolymer transport protein ExbD